ncbi:MAG TPA: ATP-binding cassette domain-containing protein [Patescibacteria group bacterium]|nr:ATP-binding cassette domain-containing protein [Patescibacteria group bacterium]
MSEPEGVARNLSAGGSARPGSLQVRALTVRFGGLVALDGVSLDVPAGKIVGIIGPNGAGKTTLFNVVCGLLPAGSGEILYNSARINGVHPHELTELGIARTLQGLGLWRGMTVLENVMAGARRAGRPGLASALLGLRASDRYESGLRDVAMGQLRELGIEDAAARYPATLPYGVQKWVSLARALAARPALLLLDEPASGLTQTEINHLSDLLVKLRERMSVAIVEHRLDLVMRVCELIHVLDFGRVIASGTPEAIRQDRGVTAAYLGEELSDAKAGGGADARG